MLVVVCALGGCAAGPVDDLRAAQPLGAAYGNSVQERWTSSSFATLRASRVPLEIQRVYLMILSLPIVFGDKYCAPGEVMSVKPAKTGADGREIWTVRVCDEVKEEEVSAGLPSSAAAASAPAYLPSDAFRERHPAPPALDELVRVHASADAALLASARMGLRTDVILTDGKGNLSRGYDEYVAATPPRFREVRATYEAVIVGRNICTRPASGRFVCDTVQPGQGEQYGLRPIVPEAVFALETGAVPCEKATCRFYTFRQADHRTAGGVLTFAPDPERSYQVRTLTVLPDGRPYSFREAHLLGGKQQGNDALYLYAYDVPVGDIALPR